MMFKNHVYMFGIGNNSWHNCVFKTRNYRNKKKQSFWTRLICSLDSLVGRITSDQRLQRDLPILSNLPRQQIWDVWWIWLGFASATTIYAQHCVPNGQIRPRTGMHWFMAGSDGCFWPKRTVACSTAVRCQQLQLIIFGKFVWSPVKSVNVWCFFFQSGCSKTRGNKYVRIFLSGWCDSHFSSGAAGAYLPGKHGDFKRFDTGPGDLMLF